MGFAPDANRPDEIGIMLVDYGTVQYILVYIYIYTQYVYTVYTPYVTLVPYSTYSNNYLRGTDLGHANVGTVKRALAR